MFGYLTVKPISFRIFRGLIKCIIFITYKNDWIQLVFIHFTISLNSKDRSNTKMGMEFQGLWWLEFITYPELDDEKPNKKTEFSSRVDRPDFIFKHHVLISRILTHILLYLPLPKMSRKCTVQSLLNTWKWPFKF